MVAISFDTAEVLRRFALKSGIQFPLLSDVGSKTIDLFGIRNPEASEGSKGIPYPGTFILDRKGVIRAKLFLEGYSERHPPSIIAQALKAAQ